MKNDLGKLFEAILEEEKPESKIYNKPFIIGVLFTIFFFIISNSLSYYLSYYEHLENYQKGISFSGGYDLFYWGFPFESCLDEMCTGGLVQNIIAIAFFSFVFGFLFRFIWSKISYRFVKVK